MKLRMKYYVGITKLKAQRERNVADEVIEGDAKKTMLWSYTA